MSQERADLVNTLIRNRRSVFQQQYTDEKVDDAIIRQMLENANWAPTHKLTEPWRFIVFTGNGIQKLAEEQAALYRQVTTAKGTYSEDRYQNLLTKPKLSSHIIAVAMKRDEKKSLPEIEEVGAVYCAIENMYLTATAYGVGCYLSTGGITHWEEARALFNLGPDDKLIGFLHVGKIKGAVPDSRRKPVDEKVTWVEG
ncbi:nitroreductase family protein [Dawidia soli]|uniref:Putative NAD(P)H nitroreductase n=1 Tax=Dawidia soli TaxID=2782352 RepID=A0AAP2D4S9_9BACT|nr:nitroreductase [Dawidia soli]MBT1685344.1 nitroreductase [Dawidia soli]